MTITQILAEINKTVVVAGHAKAAAAAVDAIMQSVRGVNRAVDDMLISGYANLTDLPWNKRDCSAVIGALIQGLQELADNEATDLQKAASELKDTIPGAAMYQEKNGSYTVTLRAGKTVNGRTMTEAIEKAIEAYTNFVPDADLLDATPRTLTEVESAIHAAFAVQHRYGMQVGVLLGSAREFLPDNSAWLAWAREKFSIGKAQVYKLVKVAETFGRDKRFSKAPATALYSLAAQGTAEQIEQAAKLAGEGKLTVQAVDLLLNPVPVVKDNSKTKSDSCTQSEQVQPVVPRVTRMQDVPWGNESSGENEGSDSTATATESASTLVKQGASAPNLVHSVDAAMADMVREISELRKQLAAAVQEASALRAEKDRKTIPDQAPMLPHFLSSDMHIRLGLTHAEAADKDNVRLAARDILKLYRGNAAVTEAITQAMETLLK